MAEHDQRGTGKHSHKDTQEPYPHHGQGSGGQQAQGSGQQRGGGQGGQGGGQSGGDQGGGQQAQGSEQESLERREYRDKDGNVHHHTRTYMEQHDKK